MDPKHSNNNNYLRPYYAAYSHLSTTSTPALSTTTTRSSTPGSPHQLDSYPWHLYPPPNSDDSTPSISKVHAPAPSTQFQPHRPRYGQYQSSNLSRPFAEDNMESSSAGPSTSASHLHHQSHTYLFPEQVQSGTSPSSYRPPSNAESTHPHPQHHPHDNSRESSSYAQHHSNSGPALQATHPSAAGGIDHYRRSASPWGQPSHRQQHHHQQHHVGGGSTGYSNSSHALPMFNNTHNPHDAYGLHSHHHPLAQTHAPLEYNFPPAGYAINDPYRSPDQMHTNLPYGYPTHSQMQHSHPLTARTSSLLDKHLNSNSRSNTPSDNNHYSSSISKMNTKITSNTTAEQNKQNARSRTTSNMKTASSTSSIVTPKPATAAASGSVNQRAVSGENDDGHHDDPSQTSYGIIDENNTTLWDLKDGPDGPRSKPPYPYLTLIRVALLSCEAKRLTLQELYDTLEARYPFFQGDQKGWKNSIRHNLSLNKCFKKETRHVLNPGKGSYWYCDPTEEYSTPRVRARRDLPANGKKTGKGKKRKAAESLDSGDGEGSDIYQPDQSCNDYNGHNDYPFNDSINSRSVKVRVGDLKLPFSRASGIGASGSGSTSHLSMNKRQRAISAPSPITPSFFNTFNTSGFTSHEQGTDAAVAPFGMTGSSSIYGTHLQPYSYPSVFHQATQVPKYEFPPYHQSLEEMPSNARHLQPHHLPPLPALINDTIPHSGATDSTFALETPRTIYSGANASARPGTANSINNGGILDGTAGLNALDRNVKEENTSASNILLHCSATASYTSPVVAHVSPDGEDVQKEGEGGNGKEEVIPGPAPAYVFPAIQKSYNDPGQTKRVFVNPSGTVTTTITPNSPPRQSHHHGGVQGNTLDSDNNASNSSLTSSNILRSPSNNTMSTTNTTSNPFAVPYSNEEAKSRPAPLFLSDKQGKQFFSPPSATSPSRHLPTEYDNMFSTAPFGMVFEAPSSRGSSPRKDSLFSGLVAR